MIMFSPGSERFYHNKNQIFFNKSCCYGPLLDPDKVSQLPEATPPGKVSSVIRTGLEMVAKAAFDPEKVIDLMQEGCGVRVVVKHKGKILKKVSKRKGFHSQCYMFVNRTCPMQTIQQKQNVTAHAPICMSLTIVKLRCALEYNKDPLLQMTGKPQR